MQASIESGGWYKRLLPDGRGCYYTPFPSEKISNHFAGNGETTPSPKEVAEFMDKNPSADFYGRSIFRLCEEGISAEEPVALPSGCYSYEPSSNATPSRLVPFDLRQDSYIALPGIYGRLAADVETFFESEPIYRDMGIQYRRGLLLYGPPGNGKTCLIRQLIKEKVPSDAVAIFVDVLPERGFLDNIKKTLGDRTKVFIFEELAAVVENCRLERVLDFLDGERSLDRTLIIGTTNYPERLPSNLVDRPSRFDRLYKMPDPDDQTRKDFLKFFLKAEDIREEDVEATKGLSVVAIREVCLLVKMRGATIGEASRFLHQHRDLVKKEFSESKSIGFARYDRPEYY